ncbi:hypothetical protein EON79_23535 [bacterium]|nr:MAG: hypothetical protein EON79_23535 [bacterium]
MTEPLPSGLVVADLESLYEDAYAVELAEWRDKPLDLRRFMDQIGAYELAFLADGLLVWTLPPFLLLLAFSRHMNISAWTCLCFSLIPGFVLAHAYARSKQKAGIYTGIGPIGRIAFREFEAAQRGAMPKRLDPWSPAAIRKTVAYARHRIRTEQEAVLERIWKTKIEAGATIRLAKEALLKIAASPGDPLLKGARVEALERTIDRQMAVARDLDAQERVVLETPNPLLAHIEALEADLAGQDAIATILDQEERTRLLEAEATAIRASVSELVSMVQSCEASLRGVASDIVARDAAERELQQALG